MAYSQASCFGRDTGFQPANAKPTVSQPSRSDPSKVMVDWSKIIKNPQCVDSFTLLVWADGTQPTTATKIQVDKNTKSKIVDIQPCVGFRFAVETNEKNTLGTKTLRSGDQTFKTAGATSNIRIDASRFKASYHWDPVKKVVDLRMATISFPRDLIPSASCLDYIQITGTQIRPRSNSATSVSRSRSFSWSHLGQTNSNPAIQVGGASTLPARTGPSYSSVARGGSAARGPTASTWSRSSSSSSSSRSPPGSPTGSRPTTPILNPPITSGAVTSPNYANTLPRPTGGATAKVGPIKIQPPFLNPIIEMNVAVQDCKEYDFEIKFFGPGSKEVGKVPSVKLPALADVPGYVPPPITSVMSISYGTTGKPVYGVKTSSGVTSACLAAYFEAYDAYTHRLENEVVWQNKEGNRVQSLITDGQNQLDSSQETLLRKTGCVCSSPHLMFSTTDASLQKKYGAQFGHYHFQGMHANKPFYKLMDITHGAAAHRPGTATSRPPVTTSRPSNVVPIFLFWEDKKKQWIFGPTVGSTSKVEFGSIPNSLAKCPGDPPATGNWQYKTSVLGRWKKTADLKVACDVHNH